MVGLDIFMTDKMGDQKGLESYCVTYVLPVRFNSDIRVVSESS